MLETGLKRRQIEDAIIARAGSIHLYQADGRFVDGDAFRDLIHAWRDLTRYYQETDDSQVSAKLLKLYMRHAVRLREVFHDDRIALHRRERAEAALMQLNAEVDALISAVQHNAGALNTAMGRLA